MLLKHYLDQGDSQSELARRFGIDRTTIWRWVRTGQLDRDLSAGSNGYSPRPPVTRKLDPCKAIIDARLEEFPKLSAKRLFDEVRAAGYPGCYEGVRNYVRVARSRAPIEPTVRFETPAGRQGQAGRQACQKCTEERKETGPSDKIPPSNAMPRRLSQTTRQMTTSMHEKNKSAVL